MDISPCEDRMEIGDISISKASAWAGPLILGFFFRETKKELASLVSHRRRFPEFLLDEME